jgi:hypothetical protein
MAVHVAKPAGARARQSAVSAGDLVLPAKITAPGVPGCGVIPERPGGSLLWRGGWRHGYSQVQVRLQLVRCQPVYPVRRVRMAVWARLIAW